jgi:hypothetical protein
MSGAVSSIPGPRKFSFKNNLRAYIYHLKHKNASDTFKAQGLDAKPCIHWHFASRDWIDYRLAAVACLYAGGAMALVLLHFYERVPLI